MCVVRRSRYRERWSWFSERKSEEGFVVVVVVGNGDNSAGSNGWGSVCDECVTTTVELG